MMWFLIVLGLVVAQRLAELWLAAQNTKRLFAEGAVEIGAGHYPLFVILHTAWLSSLAIFTPWTAEPDLWLLAVYVLLQFGRAWVILTLGRYWTTRIITLPLPSAPQLLGRLSGDRHPAPGLRTGLDCSCVQPVERGAGDLPHSRGRDDLGTAAPVIVTPGLDPGMTTGDSSKDAQETLCHPGRARHVRGTGA